MRTRRDVVRPRPLAAIPAALALALLAAAPAVPARAQESAPAEPLAIGAVNPTTPGVLTAYSTLVSAGFEWRIDGDDNGNCAVTVQYRRIDDSVWHAAQPLLRVEHGIWTHGEDPGNLLAGSLFDLQPGRTYQARLVLSDPDGGAATQTVTFATRVEPRATALRTRYVIPGSGGGTGGITDPYKGLAAADAAAQPGDLFIVQAGTYHGNFTPAHDGTAANPIVWRGASAASVILDGDGGTSPISHSVTLTNRRYVFVENMSLVNCLRPCAAGSSVGCVIRGCTVQPINQLTGTHGIEAALATDLYVEDNTVLMQGQWATLGRTGTYGTGGYGILVEGSGLVVCHNRIVEAWDAISIPTTGTAVPACVTSNVDIYENDIDRASDDGVQADAIQQNVRIFRNRLLNTGSAVSFQPAFGGPGYVMWNEMYNCRIEPYKMHQETSYGWTQETSGFLFFHNTSVCSRNAWYETGIWRHGTFRDNILAGARDGTPPLYLGYTYVGASLDYDGLYRINNYATLVRMSGSSFANFPAFYAGMGNEQHGVELPLTAMVNAPLPHDPSWEYTNGYGAAYTPADYDLHLRTGSSAIDKGGRLANVDDAFLGTAPDLGCYEYGAAAPAYGPRASIPVAAVLPPVVTPLQLEAAPNPFVTSTQLVFVLPAAGATSVRVYDLRGALVRTLAAGERSAGVHTLAWDARDDAGNACPAGIYFARVSAATGEAVRRVALAR